MTIFKRMKPGRFIVFGFITVILIGAIFLYLPISHNPGVEVHFIDAIFTATSAVCVTGLITMDTADTFNVFGRTVIALLIQIGGLGFASVGVGIMLLARKKVTFKDRLVIKEALNLESMKGIVKLVKAVLLMTICFELVGATLSYFVFSQHYTPLQAVGISAFHAISSFNNAGFDLLGDMKSLTEYNNNILLNLTTCGLIIFGGLGFYVIKEIIVKHNFKKFSLHTKIVLTMTAALLISGTLLLKFTEDIDWLGAFFFSTSARTAGFATYGLDGFTNAGLFVVIIFMFIGASPGSTGGGVKTTTIFTLMRSAYSSATNTHCTSFKRKLPHDIVTKAFILVTLAVSLVCVDTFLLSVFQPEESFVDLFFEAVSAFGTVGLSTGVTPRLTTLSKLVIIITMFIGRLGPLTMATIWTFKPISNVTYSEETIIIG
jgi:trk system potassium uptake protein TrkH